MILNSKLKLLKILEIVPEEELYHYCDRFKNPMKFTNLCLSGILILLSSNIPVARGTELPFVCRNLENREINSANESAKLPPIEVKFIREEFSKPPLSHLYFDIILRNPNEQPQWFILPELFSLSHPSPWTQLLTDSLSVSEMKGEKHVFIGVFRGYTSFYALLLPARGEVKIRDFKIDKWGNEFEPIFYAPIRVAMTKQLQIGGEPVESWFASNPLSENQADVSFNLNQEVSKKDSDRLVPLSLVQPDCIQVIVDTF